MTGGARQQAMHVVLLNHNLARSRGTFWRALEIGKALTRAGHHATLITTSARRRWRSAGGLDSGVRILETPALVKGPLRSGSDPIDLVRRLGWAAGRVRHDIDIIHAFDSRPTVILPALLARRRTGAALVMDWADWWGRGGTTEERASPALLRAMVRPVETYFEEAFRTKADATTVISSPLRERALRLGVLPESIALVRQGCNPHEITPLDLEVSRQACGLPPAVPVLGHLGVLLPADAALLMAVFRDVRIAIPEARLLLIGDPAVKLPPDPGLIRTGIVPAALLPTYLAACNLFLLPLTDSIANRARWPSKANSYFAAGRPVVTSPVGDLATEVARHDAGRVGSPGDGTFQRACVQLITDRGMAERLGHNARALAENQLSWDTIISVILRAYACARDRRRIA